MEYHEDDFLQLSGLQHFAFCRRQWALIHIEGQWADNYRTIDGSLMHENAHDPSFVESRPDRVVTRSVGVYSTRLGVSGQCDVLEYIKSDQGIALPGKSGLWQPFPVEYKRGAPKETDADVLQLCAQAMCLEDMLCCDIPQGAVYYGQIRRRERVEFTPDLRARVKELLKEMHELYDRGHTPKARQTKACNACSLREICLPKLAKKRPVAEYLRSAMEEQQ